MKLKWPGTATILLEHEGTQLLFDPFLSLNETMFRPSIPELAAVENILVTHGHLDHTVDIPKIIGQGDGGATVWCTQAPRKVLISKGVSGERIRTVKPGDDLEFPPLKVRVLKGKHIKFDMWRIVTTLLSPRMIKHRKNLSYMRKENKASVEAGETVIYDISVPGEHILLMGSLNLDDNTEYPLGVDLLILPFQGRSDITGYAMRIVDRLQPRKILLDHFDDTFPPISSGVRTGRFVKKMQRDFPAVPVICRPAGSEWIVLDGSSEQLPPPPHVLQLAEMGIRFPVISSIRSKDGVHVYRVESKGENYILKTFDNPEDRREISNYELLSALGIPTIPMLNHTESALLLPDMDASGQYRLGMESDMSDPQTARAIARWYKTLHSKGRETKLAGLYAETDVVTLENMDIIALTTDTQDNPVWPVIRERFSGMRRAIDALPYTLTYNDFYWTNLVVARDGLSAMMLDFNLLGKGYVYGDIRNVTSSLTGAAKEAFLNEYGAEQIPAGEMEADAVLSPLVTLLFACKHERFPIWAEQSLIELKSGMLLENLRKWLT